MRHILLPVLWMSILMLPGHTLKAQVETSDTIAMVQQLQQEKHFADAVVLLRGYQDRHRDFPSLRMLAETYYWSGDLNKANRAYTEALVRFPEQYRVHLEIARVLFAQNKLHEARDHLTQFLALLPQHPEANYLMGVTYYWQGDFNKARRYLQTAVQLDSQNQDYSRMLQDLTYAMTPVFDLGSSYETDDQPLDGYGIQGRFGFYRSTIFAPHLEEATHWYTQSAQTNSITRIRIGNTFTWWHGGAQLTLSGGALVSDQTDVLWSADLSKNLPHAYALKLSARRLPYLWTAGSISHPPLYREYAVQFMRQKTDGIQMTMAFEDQHLRSNLHSYSAYAWALTPPLMLGPVALRAGYGFSYADANDNLFVPVKSLDEILMNYDSTAAIKGIFDPFYTPEDQMTHGALASVSVGNANSFQVSINGNVGIYARANHPYFYLDLDGNEIVIRKGFYRATYTPYTLDCKVSWNLSDHIALTGHFRDFKSLFYHRYTAELGMQVKLFSDER